MLGSVASALIYVQKRRLVEVFPEDVRKVWKEWEVRIFIIFSLVLQVALILLGNQRKYKGRLGMRVTVWSAYLLSDWVATVALGVISQNTLDDCKKSDIEESRDEIMSFWTPFLLLHLGGPDTITAYSLEDNELWLRRLVELGIQSGLAMYVLLVAMPGPSYLFPCSVLILIAGLIKYAERILALRSANLEHLRNSMLTPPDAGPNYAKFMEEFTLKKTEGFYVEVDEVQEPHVRTENMYPEGRGRFISEAYNHFETFKRLFVDLILSIQDRENSRQYFQELPPERAEKVFDVIGIELGFAFDIFFTKAPVVYTVKGCILRLVTLSLTSMSMLTFWILNEKDKYETEDLVITTLLHVVAILLEIYAAYVLLSSDWMVNWLSKHSKARDLLITPFLQPSDKPRWSNCMAQYNLLGFCLDNRPARFYGIQKFFQIEEFLEKQRHRTYAEVSSELKGLVINYFEKFEEKNEVDPSTLFYRKGSFAIEINECSQLDWTTKIEYDQRILIWHIATDLCYYSDMRQDPERADISSTESKHISDYMLYLLVMCPFMLPVGIGMIRFRDTCAEAREFFKDTNVKSNIIVACKKLLKVNTEVVPAKVKGDRSKSVLFDACRLAKSLQGFEESKRWEIINDSWVELLAYGASHCRSNHHAQQLRKGGEFLTHVWLLMAHLGITEQFQIHQGHARAKLIAK